MGWIGALAGVAREAYLRIQVSCTWERVDLSFGAGDRMGGPWEDGGWHGKIGWAWVVRRERASSGYGGTVRATA